MKDNLNWKTTKDNIPTVPSNDFGWSNQILVYSESEDTWFEAVYHFNDSIYYLIDHTPLYNITHFCEVIPVPQKEIDWVLLAVSI